MYKQESWTIRWNDGIFNLASNYGYGDCFLTEPNSTGSYGRQCWPDFREPTVDSWTANGYDYGRWEQHVYDKQNSSAGCIISQPVRIEKTAVRSCGPASSCPRTSAFISQCFQNGGDYDDFSCTCTGCMDCGESPILIDLVGDGFNLSDAANGVYFDLNGDGTPERIAWTRSGSDDGFLALDRDFNGQIDNGAELFGNFTPQPAGDVLPNGFIALAVYDEAARGGNGDGVIDSRDGIFSALRLWRDTNHNGFSEPSEVRTLESSNIVSIKLDYKESRRTDANGNRFRYRAKVKDANDSRVGGWAWDVFFVSVP